MNNSFLPAIVFAACLSVVAAAFVISPDSGTPTPQAEIESANDDSQSGTTPPKQDSRQQNGSEDLPPVIVEEPAETPQGMVWIPGGEFIMGTDYRPAPGKPNPDRIKPDEYPPHRVEVDGFWMDITEVTNAEFKRFVDETGYVTFPERKPKREDFIGAVPDINEIPEENLVPGSLVMNYEFDQEKLVRGVPNWEYQVWTYRRGANWKHPEGPDTDIKDRMDHPVVHVTYEDAQAYCEWAGKRLPTEAEYEYAALGGKKKQKYFWGNDLVPDGQYNANFWQGDFPTKNDHLDGFPKTSPVRTFQANGYGLYDIAGNAWEWCSDFYRPDYYAYSPVRNPQGPKNSFDPQEPGQVKRTMRGGSFLCNTNNCTGYRIAARMRGEVTSAAFHHGFRCVVDSNMVEEYQNAPRTQLVASKPDESTESTE